MTILRFILRLLFRGCITTHLDPVDAWQALGRRVKKGEHGVHACTFVPVKGKQEQNELTGETKRKAGYRLPRTTTVFHISQTEPIQ